MRKLFFRWLIDSSQLNYSYTLKQFSVSGIVDIKHNNIKWHHLRCSYSSNGNFVLAETYAFILIMLSLVLSVFNRNIKRNYKVI